jgi:hypothetical protein
VDDVADPGADFAVEKFSALTDGLLPAGGRERTTEALIASTELRSPHLSDARSVARSDCFLRSSMSGQT